MPRFLQIAVTLAILLVCVTAHAEPVPEREVCDIEWSGLEVATSDDLEAAILTTEASWKFWQEARPYDPGTLEQDLNRIRRFYQQKGYYEAAVRSEVEEKGDDAVVVRIFVEEGQPIVLERLLVTLAAREGIVSPLSESELQAGLPLSVGENFSPERYEQSKQEIRRRLAARSFPSPKIGGGAEVDVAERRASVDWTVDLGPFVRLGEVSVTGLERVAADLVLGEVLWKPGDPYDPEVLRKTQRAIFELGLFRSVSIQPVVAKPANDGEAVEAAVSEQQWPLEIRLIERPPRVMRASVGFGTEDGVRVKGSWKHRNLFGGLRSLRLEGKYSFLERGAELVFVQPRFLDRETDLTLDVVFSEETEPGFDTRGVSTGWLLERPLFEKWKGRIGQRYEFRKVTDVDGDAAVVRADDNKSFQLVFFTTGVRRSSLDSAVDPHSGSWLDFSVEPSFKELGSDVDYVKALAEGRYFFPLPWNVVIATRVRLGTLEPFGADQASDVPVFKRFFSGGSASVRGFEFNHLGPLDDDQDPLGGLTLAEASVELRFPIWRDLGGAGFFDAGQISLDSFDLSRHDFSYAAGGGFRYKTPIGPLRLDFARILNPPSGIADFRVHFSVGHTF